MIYGGRASESKRDPRAAQETPLKPRGSGYSTAGSCHPLPDCRPAGSPLGLQSRSRPLSFRTCTTLRRRRPQEGRALPGPPRLPMQKRAPRAIQSKRSAFPKPACLSPRRLTMPGSSGRQSPFFLPWAPYLLLAWATQPSGQAAPSLSRESQRLRLVGKAPPQRRSDQAFLGAFVPEPGLPRFWPAPEQTARSFLQSPTSTNLVKAFSLRLSPSSPPQILLLQHKSPLQASLTEGFL